MQYFLPFLKNLGALWCET